MIKSKYHFDPDSLSYDKVSVNKRRKFIRNVFTQVFASLFFAVVFFIAISYIFESPKQKKLKRENEVLETQYEQMYERYQQTENVLKDIKDRDRNIYKAIFETEPPVDEDTVDYFKELQKYDNKELIGTIRTKLNSVNEKLKTEEQDFKELIDILKGLNNSLLTVPSIQPLTNRELKLTPYGFGKRIDPVYKTQSFHKGIDFAAPKGTEVFATANGIVSFVGDKRNLGINIVINHQNKFETTYAHLSETVVRNGQKVKRGQVIGFVGNTGKSLVSHLHYQINYNNEPINPVHFFFQDLSPSQYDKMLLMASRGGLSLD